MVHFKTQSEQLSELLHCKWSLPVLSAMSGRGNQAKFVTIQKELSIARNSLKRSLEYLIQLGLVKPNEGYGHPLRPEYLLTSRGRKIAPACGHLLRKSENLGVTEVSLKKWSLPVLLALTSETRFNHLQSEITHVTPRALANTLQELVQFKLSKRSIVDRLPPFTEYSLTKSGRHLATLAAKLTVKS